MLRTARDVGKAEFCKVIRDHALRTLHAETLCDHINKVNPPPANNTIGLSVRPGFNNLCEFLHLLVVQQPGPSGTFRPAHPH